MSDGRRHVVTVGAFDGVHRGHRAVLDVVRAEAAARGARSVALAFDPHPLAVLAPERCPLLLTSLGTRLRLLTDAGMDIADVWPFTPATAQLEPDEFLAAVAARYPLAALIVGPDHALGHQRRGTRDVLAALGAARGFAVRAVDPLILEGGAVSSTRIRGLVASGDIAGAERLLGRPYTISGPVLTGDGRGRTLGYPTANIGVDPARLLPADGIYAVWVDGATPGAPGVAPPPLAGALSIGVRPTFVTDGRRTVEVFLLDFSGVLLGRTLRVTFIERLRDEQRFATADALIAQIDDDVARTRAALRARATAPTH